MRALIVLIGVLLAALAGVFFLAGIFWYRYALELHAERLFPDDSFGVALLRYGVAAGFLTFGGFLLAFVLHLMAVSAGAAAGGPLSWVPFRETAVGLFLFALGLFIIGGTGYAVDAVRSAPRSVR